MRARDAASARRASALDSARPTSSVKSAIRVSAPGGKGPPVEEMVIAPHRSPPT